MWGAWWLKSCWSLGIWLWGLGFGCRVGVGWVRTGKRVGIWKSCWGNGTVMICWVVSGCQTCLSATLSTILKLCSSNASRPVFSWRRWTGSSSKIREGSWVSTASLNATFMVLLPPIFKALFFLMVSRYFLALQEMQKWSFQRILWLNRSTSEQEFHPRRRACWPVQCERVAEGQAEENLSWRVRRVAGKGYGR